MSSEHMRVVEIGGVKMEVDTRTAKTIEHYKIGDRVKVLVKGYGDSYSTYHGVIVAFDEFKKLPTITICYIKPGYNVELEFVAINAQQEDIEICAANDDVLVEKGEILAKMDAEINKKLAEVEDIRRKKTYFETRFGQFFGEE